MSSIDTASDGIDTDGGAFHCATPATNMRCHVASSTEATQVPSHQKKVVAQIDELERKLERHFIMDIAVIWIMDSLPTNYGHCPALAGDPTN